MASFLHGKSSWPPLYHLHSPNALGQESPLCHRRPNGSGGSSALSPGWFGHCHCWRYGKFWSFSLRWVWFVLPCGRGSKEAPLVTSQWGCPHLSECSKCSSWIILGCSGPASFCGCSGSFSPFCSWNKSWLGWGVCLSGYGLPFLSRSCFPQYPSGATSAAPWCRWDNGSLARPRSWSCCLTLQTHVIISLFTGFF